MVVPNLSRAAFFGVLLMLFVGLSFAQTTQGGLTGEVRDEKGANIAGAKVTVLSRATGLQRETTTAENGTFHVLALPAGLYELRAEAYGIRYYDGQQS